MQSQALEMQSHRISMLEHAVKQGNPTGERDADARAPGRPSHYQDAASPALHGPGDDGYSSPEDAQIASGHKPPVRVSLDEAQRTLREMQNDDDADIVPGAVVPAGEPAMPINHTTLAGLLLGWTPIRERVQPFLDEAGIRYIDEYPHPPRRAARPHPHLRSRRGLRPQVSRGQGRLGRPRNHLGLLPEHHHRVPGGQGRRHHRHLVTVARRVVGPDGRSQPAGLGRA